MSSGGQPNGDATAAQPAPASGAQAAPAGQMVWTERAPAGELNWTQIVSSADGSRLAARIGTFGILISSDGGSTWTDLALSNGPNDFSGEILIDRSTADFYSVYSVYVAGASQLKARHGTFS